MNKLYKLFLLAVLTYYTGPASAQASYANISPLYDHSNVARIDILIHPDSLLWIMDNVESNHEFKAVFVYNNGNVNDTVTDIGFRLRGNTSRFSAKKSFKVSFNTFMQGRKYYGVEKLNLNGEHNDPSVSRARLYWHMLHEADIVGPASNHVRVYINGDYYGVYLNVEHVDEEFVKNRYGNNDGNLYKCLYPADLTYRGKNPSVYKLEQSGRRVYELKTNEEADDYTDIANFIDVLNNASIAQLPCSLEKIFNVQDYLKVAALDVLTGNWDGYIYNKNNFYLYNNPQTGLFEYIPYDTDNTFGIDWFNIDWSSRNIYSWAPSSEQRPLFKRLMQVPEYKAQYTYYLKQFIEHVTATELTTPWLDEVKNQISEYLETDPYYPLDYGYTPGIFNASFTQPAGDHVKMGITAYIAKRNQTALNQAASSSPLPMLAFVSRNQPQAWQKLKIEAKPENYNIKDVKLKYRFDQGGWNELLMNDAGSTGDALAADGVYTAELPGKAEGTVVEYQVQVTDNSGASALKPCEPATYKYTTAKTLFINEFMASNSNEIIEIEDEFDESDDWIEIYNASDQPVWLGDKYLTDNLSNPTKWAFPDVTIPAKGYLIVWADGQPEQGPLHTTYKLDKDSEEIGLFDNNASGNALLDSVVYVNQTTDVSMGRVTDGQLEWKFFTVPTPGFTNSPVGLPEIPVALSFKVWPNPVTGNTLYLQEPANFSIYDITGRKYADYRATSDVDVSDMKQGLWILRTEDGRTARFIVKTQ